MSRTTSTLKTIAIVLAIPVALYLMLITMSFAHADQPEDKKVLVCKYVGTPGVNERLQTGQNPIEVAVNSIDPKNPEKVVPGYEFPDKHGRSVVVAIDGCLPATPDKDPVLCPTGTTLVEYEDPTTKQKPICKGVPEDEVENTTPEWVPTSDGGMMDPLTGEVFYGK